MPATRKSTRKSGAASGNQATLSFNHRVTKTVPKVGKDVKDVISDTLPAKPSPLAKSRVVDDSSSENEPIVSEPTVAEPKPQVDQPEAVIEASKVTERQIQRYWNDIEAERTAKRVHQEELNLHEKVLRYFDVSTQYGPSIGASRMKRWMRADKLGLNPPVEVLAALLNEESAGNKQAEKSQIDVIVGSG